mmetsp:Transcript_29712/g.79826  ORF Transcript_29712/g.79826 Transcript_29712/m.79826 type:complete len:218 (+) Transcript_29712:147-800(+)
MQSCSSINQGRQGRQATRRRPRAHACAQARLEGYLILRPSRTSTFPGNPFIENRSSPELRSRLQCVHLLPPSPNMRLRRSMSASRAASSALGAEGSALGALGGGGAKLSWMDGVGGGDEGIGGSRVPVPAGPELGGGEGGKSPGGGKSGPEPGLSDPGPPSPSSLPMRLRSDEKRSSSLTTSSSMRNSSRTLLRRSVSFLILLSSSLSSWSALTLPQ